MGIYVTNERGLQNVKNIYIASDAFVNEYLQSFTWLKGDGNNFIAAYRPIPGSNINKSKDITMRAIVKIDDLRDIGKRTALSGASSVIDGIRGRYLSIAFYRKDADTFSVGYFGCVDASKELEFFGDYHIGDVLDIEGAETTLKVNGITYNKTTEEMARNLSIMAVLHSADVLGDKKFNASVSRLQYIAKGVVYSDLIPAKVIKELPAELSYTNVSMPVGTVGMWDKINEKFLTSASTNNWILTN